MKEGNLILQLLRRETNRPLVSRMRRQIRRRCSLGQPTLQNRVTFAPIATKLRDRNVALCSHSSRSRLLPAHKPRHGFISRNFDGDDRAFAQLWIGKGELVYTYRQS
jgi:hypothetical protein